MGIGTEGCVKRRHADTLFVIENNRYNRDAPKKVAAKR
jgi:hypothetical protein